MKYKYIGNQPVNLIGFGKFRKGDLLETDQIIKNPNFKEIKKIKKRKRK